MNDKKCNWMRDSLRAHRRTTFILVTSAVLVPWCRNSYDKLGDMLRCAKERKKYLVIKCHPYFKLIWKHWHDKCLWSVWKRYGFYDQREFFYAVCVRKKTCFIRWNYGYFHHLHQWQQAAIKKGYIFFHSIPTTSP